MKISNAVGAVGAIAVALVGWNVPAQAQSDSVIRQKIVRASIAAYSGSCPCPYNTDRVGRSCGRRSAYTRPGGYPAKCYASDVTAAEVKAYRAGR
jgi:hypothetical protein